LNRTRSPESLERKQSGLDVPLAREREGMRWSLGWWPFPERDDSGRGIDLDICLTARACVFTSLRANDTSASERLEIRESGRPLPGDVVMGKSSEDEKKATGAKSGRALETLLDSGTESLR
jgi:hypothetical protein